MPTPVDVFQRTRVFAERILGMEAPSQPTRLTAERKEWFRRALQEELDEFVQADNLADEIDAVIDLIYFAAGRLFEMGVDGGLHFDEVHGANVEKKKGRLEKRSHGLDDTAGVDAVKPADWEGPNHERLLAFQRYQLGMAFITRAGSTFYLPERPVDPLIEDDGLITYHPKPTVQESIDAMRPAAGLLTERKRPKVLVLGHARHGKDTAAEMLRDGFGYSFQSSSMFCCERVMMPYFNSLQGHPGYATPEDCYEDRVNHRATWFQQIEAYNSGPEGWSRLAREMLETSDLYVGMRSPREYQACLEGEVFDHIIWIEDPRKPPEPRDSFDIEYDPERMHLVLNDGTLEDLLATLSNLVLNTLEN